MRTLSPFDYAQGLRKRGGRAPALLDGYSESVVILPLLVTLVQGAAVPSIPLLTVEEVQSVRSVSVPPGAQRVGMLTLVLHASCARDISVTGVTLLHRGMGDARDVTSVSVVSDGRRVASSREISPTSGQVTFTFRSVLVPACGERTLSFSANFSPSAAPSGEHRLLLASPEDVETDGAPVRWGAHTPQQSSAVLRTVGEPVSTVTVEALPLLLQPVYGSQRTVGRFRVSTSGTHDQFLLFLTLTNDGSARDTDLQNLSVIAKRQMRVTPVLPSLEGDLAPFVFDPPLLLEHGNVYLIEVRADVRASRRRTIRLLVEEPEDVEAREAVRGR